MTKLWDKYSNLYITKDQKTHGTFLSRPRLQVCNVSKSYNWEIPKVLALLWCDVSVNLTLRAEVVVSASIVTLVLVLPICISWKSLHHLTPNQVPGWELCSMSLWATRSWGATSWHSRWQLPGKAVEVVKKERYGHWEELLWYTYHLAHSFCLSHNCPWTKLISIVWYHQLCWERHFTFLWLYIVDPAFFFGTSRISSVSISLLEMKCVRTVLV